MANATVTNLGQANATGDSSALFLKVFAGEVLAAFQRTNKMLPITMVRTISSGKQATFPAKKQRAISKLTRIRGEVKTSIVEVFVKKKK